MLNTLTRPALTSETMETNTPISDYFSLPPLVLNPEMPEDQQAVMSVYFIFHMRIIQVFIVDPMKGFGESGVHSEIGNVEDVDYLMDYAENKYGCELPPEYREKIRVFNELSPELHGIANDDMRKGADMRYSASRYAFSPAIPGYCSSPSLRMIFEDSNTYDTQDPSFWLYRETLEGRLDDDDFMHVAFYRLHRESEVSSVDGQIFISEFIDHMKPYLDTKKGVGYKDKFSEYIVFGECASPDEVLPYLKALPETAHLAYDPTRSDDS